MFIYRRVCWSHQIFGVQLESDLSSLLLIVQMSHWLVYLGDRRRASQGGLLLESWSQQGHPRMRCLTLLAVWLAFDCSLWSEVV